MLGAAGQSARPENNRRPLDVPDRLVNHSPGDSSSYRWTTLTPDGRRLLVSRESGLWTVVCEGSAEARSELLDVALIEAIRSNSDHGSDPGTVDSTSWTRALADRFEREADQCEQRRKKETLPSRGDRIELAQGLGFSVRGTVQYVDQVQALVKLDDGRSRSLRIGIDGFRIVSPDETA